MIGFSYSGAPVLSLSAVALGGKSDTAPVIPAPLKFLANGQACREKLELPAAIAGAVRNNLRIMRRVALIGRQHDHDTARFHAVV